MRRIPRKQLRQKRESTIALINIVFLMLIFFLVAGTLTTPLDQDVDIASLQLDQQAPPPDMVFIREDGSLTWQGTATDIPSIMERWESVQNVEKAPMRIAADRNLSAMKLLETIEEFKATGAEEIKLVIQKDLQ
ncbi:MAG: biopolymer transporter ExbD [Pseudomonadota bacterium]